MAWKKEQLNFNRTLSFINSPKDIDFYRLIARTSSVSFNDFSDKQKEYLLNLDKYKYIITKKSRVSKCIVNYTPNLTLY